MNKSSVKYVLGGIAIESAALVVFQITRRWTEQSEVASLFNMLSGLVLVVPGLIASLTIWSLFVMFSVAYGALVGWLYSVSLRRRKSFVLIISLVHLAGLVFIDLVWKLIPSPVFWK